MPLFKYTAAKNTGEVVIDEKDAPSEKALAQLVKNEGLFLLQINKKVSLVTAVGVITQIRSFIFRIKPIGLVEKMFFTRNLAVMISAGLSLTRALETLALESSNTKFRNVIEEVNESLIAGKSFADSLRIHQKVFGDLFINMVSVGEASGKLTLVLKLLANQMRKDYTLKKRIRGAMMYPAIIVIALVGIGTLMLVYIVPTLAQTITELGASLPLSTRVIITLSGLMIHYSLFVLGGGVVVGYTLWRFLRTARGKAAFGRVIIKIPIFGPLIKKFNLARFCRTLAYLIEAGVPIVKSLEITGSVLGNIEFQRAVAVAAEEIQKGQPLHGILEIYPKIFPHTVTQMIGVGEETGKIDTMLLRLAIFFEEDVAETTKNLSTVIEPLLMIVVGAGVGFFAISMLQPIYSSLGNL